MKWLIALFCLAATAARAEDPYVNLTLHELQSPVYSEIFDKQNVFTGAETTWAELYTAAHNRYLLYKTQLQTDWGLAEPELEIAFYLNVVANLFPFGDVRAPDGTYSRPACIFHNKYLTAEQGVLTSNGVTYKLPRIYPADYLRATFGCCNDFALLLYMLLKQAGFDANMTGTYGHIYVEVTFPSTRWVADSTFNFMTKQSNRSFLQQRLDRESVYYVFPYLQADPTHPQYRQRAATRRHIYLLNRGRTDRLQPRDFPKWNRFDEWMALGYVATP
jgi:hypothetical protein